jgi:hypothetical protein
MGIEFEEYTANKIGSEQFKKDYLDDRSVRKIQKIYQLDFETFGYSLDPYVTEPVTGNRLENFCSDRISEVFEKIYGQRPPSRTQE